MKRSERFWDRLGELTDLQDEWIPNQGLVEIAGYRRVLIERHCGVKAYGREKIIIKMKYGYLHVCGASLELGCVSREQLVIRGEIMSISLQRR